jgi:hypothetical protein
MKLEAEALREAREAKADAARIERQKRVIARLQHQAAAFAADLKAGKVVVIPRKIEGTAPVSEPLGGEMPPPPR